MKKIVSILAAFSLLLCPLTSCKQQINSIGSTNFQTGFYQTEKAQEYGEYRGIGATFFEDNKCEISFSMTGDFFYGTYEVGERAVICKLTTLQGEYIKTKSINLEYHFKVVDDKQIEFEKAVGKVGEYVYTIDGTKYDFETQFSHFEKGESFVYRVSSKE